MPNAAANHRFWIDMSLECVRLDHTNPTGNQKGPFLTARALGMALAAPNAVYALAARRTPLLPLSPVPDMFDLTSKQRELAACAACSELLKQRYPSLASMLDTQWLNWLQSVANDQLNSAAEVLGRAVGMAIHQLGANDARYGMGNMYAPSGLPYTHERPPTQPMQGFAGADWGFADRLMTTRVADFPVPPGRTSATVFNVTQHYKDDFNRVKAKGGINSGTPQDTRTTAEEFIGIAWGYDGPPKLGTPPRLYLQAVLSVLDGLPGPALSTEEELEIIAGVGLAMAEAGIDAWYYKYAPTHMMWRPAVGIRKADAAGTTADPKFLPLGRPDTNGRGLGLTPDFPAYPSGHATFGAAAFELLRLYLVQKGVKTFKPDGDDKFPLDFVSDEYNGVNTEPRTQLPRDRIPVKTTSLWRAIVDNSISRVYLGVHWQFDGLTQRNAAGTDDEFATNTSTLLPGQLGKTGGVWLGRQIAKQVAIKLGVTPATIAASKLT